MNKSHNKKQHFIGIVKFFDVNKNSGYIASNNCNMYVSKYNQDFYVCASSFIEEEAKKKGSIVVFQVEKQENGMKRAVNVRCITESYIDVNLALSYYGKHEYVEYNNGERINIYMRTFQPIKLVAKKVQTIIENDKNRSPERTTQHFQFFVNHYPKEDFSKGCYIFDRQYSTEKKVIWEALLSVFTNEECLAISQIYPSIIKYFNDTNLIRHLLNEILTENCTLTSIQEVKTTFDYIPQECAEYAQKRIEFILDVRIKELFVELSKRSDINEKDFSQSNRNRIQLILNNKYGIINELWYYLHLTSISYDKEKEQCITLSKKNHFKKELTNFIAQITNQHTRNDFFNYLKSLPKEEFKAYEKDILSLLDNYINEKSFYNATYIINLLQIIGNKHFLYYKQILLPSIIDFLSESLHNDLDSPELLQRNFFPSYNLLTSIYEKENKITIEQMLIPILRKTKSVETLSCVSTEPYRWLSIDEALSLTKQLVSSWNYHTIKEFVSHNLTLFDKDIRFAEIVIEKANELIGDIPLTHFFDKNYAKENENKANGSHIVCGASFLNIDEDTTSYSKNPERENCFFLNGLRKLIPNGQQSNHWNNYVGSRNANDLLIMFDNKVINSIPEFVVKYIIDSISLESVYAHQSRWYNKPTLHNQAYRKILETTPINLFPLIANRLVQLELLEDAIPLAVLLVELMTCNKPPKDDNWEQHFRIQLANLKNNTFTKSYISAILWAVHFKSTTSMAALADVFTYLPPYTQIRCVKKLFQLIAQGKIQYSAESLYNFIKGKKNICFPLEIAFTYLIHREKYSSATLDNNIMLQLMDGREDHAEWIGIRQLVTECLGRWEFKTLSDDHSNQKHNNYFNGFINKEQDNRLRLFIPNKMIDKYSNLTNYSNKYFQSINELISITYVAGTDFEKVNEKQGISYYFDKSYEPKLFAIIRPFNFKFHRFDNLIDFEKKEDEDDYFCECRLSDKVDKYHQIAFYWCKNKPCFRPPVRYMLEDEWENYTLLDFMRILKIPTDYTDKRGKKIQFGCYIILSSYLKSFAKFYEHLKCRNCEKLMKPTGISNFATHAVTEFACKNNLCTEYEKIVYLNHCFNRPKCNATIDSRDSKQCPNGQYICPECGACCSTKNTLRQINNLHKTGGYLSEKLKHFVHNDLGHWEKHIIFCYKCGKPMTLQPNNHYVCTDCGTEYNNVF